MKTATYLIIGGGMTGAAAVEGIRSIDPQGSIVMLSAEKHLPYNRPPLSKGLWKGKPLDSIWRKISAENTEIILGRQAVELEPDRKIVRDDQGEAYAYDKLLLATGGTPRRLPFGGDEVTYYRDLEDYRRLRSLTGPHARFGVIGGGFIGSEIAAALRMNGQKVVMLFPESGIGANIFPGDLAAFITDHFQEQGVEVLSGLQVVNIQGVNWGAVIQTSSGQSILVDHVVAGIGIRPNSDLAEAAGLAVENGILVDSFLRTSAPDIYAAGDVANFFAPALERRMRVEHEDNALQMGRTAGMNMAGASHAYTHIPLFYSDLFDLGYEAVGRLSAQMEIASEWKEPFREGTLYYLEDGRIEGVLLWNVWGQADQARQMIGKPYSQVHSEALHIEAG